MAAAQKYTLIQLVDQKSVGSSTKQCTMSKEEATAYRKSSPYPTTDAERTTAANETNVSSLAILIKIWVKVSSRKWGRSNNKGEGLSAHSVRVIQSGLSAWCRSCFRHRVPVYQLWQCHLMDRPWPIAWDHRIAESLLLLAVLPFPLCRWWR